MKSRLFAFAEAVDARQKPRLCAPPSAPLRAEGAVNALEVNLASGSCVRVRIPDSFMDAYLGGRTLACRLFAEHACGDNPADNPIIITAGLLNNTLTPYGDNFSIAFHSPVTGRLCVFGSDCGFGSKMKALGLDAIIITGKSQQTGTIEIGTQTVFTAHPELKGLSTAEIENVLRHTPEQAILTTGPAADNGAPFAAPVCENTVLGRGGLGLLMGQKNLKAIILNPDPENLEAPLKTTVNSTQRSSTRARTRLKKILQSSRYLGRYGLNVLYKGMRAGFIPVCGFSERTDPRAQYLLSKQDISLAIYHGEPCQAPLLSTQTEGLPYAVSSMLGTNLGVFNIDRVREWGRECVLLGLDPVSAGNVIGWAVQERRKGNLEEYPELEDLSVRNVSRFLSRLAKPWGRKLYGLMALGAAELKTSGLAESSTLHEISGLECGPFDYRGLRAMAIEDYYGYQLTCPCEPFMPLYNETPRRLAKFIVWNNNISEGLESAGFSHLVSGPVLCERENIHSFASFLCPTLFLPWYTSGLFNACICEATGLKLRRNAIRDIGRACYLLETGINRVLSPNPPVFDNYFSTQAADSISAAKVVPFTKLRSYYEKERLNH